MNNIKIISQVVDTLKLHFYPTKKLTDNQISKYNKFVDDMKELKQNAMTIKNDNSENRYIKTPILNTSFNVMATSVKSFSVLLQNGDITLALKHITNLSSNPVVKVEFRSEFLVRYGYVDCINKTNNIIDSFLGDYDIKVSEIHLATDIQGYDFNKLDMERLKYRNRTLQGFVDIDSSLFSSGTKLTGYSIGKGDFMLRIYDKSHHINLNKKAGYIKTHRWESNKDFIPTEKVWRFEFQFRRKYLKTLVGKDGILDGFTNVLNSINDIWKHATERITHYELSDKHCVDSYLGYFMKKDKKMILSKENQRKRLSRSGLSQLWETISIFNDYESKNKIHKIKEIKKPEVAYVINAYKGLVSTLVKLNMGKFDKNMLSEIIYTASEDELNKSGFSILDNAKLKAVDYINDSKKDFIKNGIFSDGFEEYNYNLKENLKETLNEINERNYHNRFFDEVLKRGTLLNAS